VARVPGSHTGHFLARYYDDAATTSIDPAKLPPIELPDLQKKAPKPKFIAPERKTGLPTASKIKPESDRPKAKKATKKAAKAPGKPAKKAAKTDARK
jgi:excinuclease ABC subunit A